MTSTPSGHIGIHAGGIEAAPIQRIDRYRHIPWAAISRTISFDRTKPDPIQPQRHGILEKQHTFYAAVGHAGEHLHLFVTERDGLRGRRRALQRTSAERRPISASVARALVALAYSKWWTITPGSYITRYPACRMRNAQIGVLVTGRRECFIEAAQIVQQRPARHQKHTGTKLHVTREIRFRRQRRGVAP